MKKFMRFEKEEFAVPKNARVDGILINPESITDIVWYDNEIYFYLTGQRDYHKIKNTPEIRDYLKEFGFYIDKETKE